MFFLMIRRPPRSTLLTHSFPTRRSSDLLSQPRLLLRRPQTRNLVLLRQTETATQSECPAAAVDSRERTAGRSEEHTTELQSLMRISYAVFCLNKKIQRQIHKQND